MSSALLRSFLGGVLSREFGDRSFALICVLKSIFYEEFVRMCPRRISVQVESQADHARPDECWGRRPRLRIDRSWGCL